MSLSELTGVTRTIPMKAPGKKRILPLGLFVGVKTNSHGKYEVWKGVKIPVAVVDGGRPVSCLLTLAKLTESQTPPFFSRRGRGRLWDAVWRTPPTMPPPFGGRMIFVRGNRNAMST